MEDHADRNWHLDKRVNVSIIVALAAHLGASVWWASTMSEKMTQVERRVEALAHSRETTDDRVNSQSREIAVLAQRMDSTIDSVDSLRAEVSVTNNLIRELLRGRGP